MKTLHVITTLSTVMGLAACSPTPVPTAQGALVSSALARQNGVGSYLLHDGDVDVLSVEGTKLGVVHVSAPTTDTRLVRVEYLFGQYAENEITRPLADGSFRAPVTRDRNGAIQADPALASFFAGHQLAFFVAPEAPAQAALGGDALANCSDVTWPASCFQKSCSTSQDYWSGGTHYTQVLAYAGCPATYYCNSICYGQDEVSKYRTCADPGSCSQQANGATGNCLQLWCYGPGQYCCEGSCGNSPCP